VSARLVISIVIGLIVLSLSIVVYALQKKEKRPVDYRSLFIMGTIWLPVGIFFLLMHFLFDRPFVIGMPFLTMGLIYLVIALANKDKWKESKPLTASQKKIIVGLMAAGIIVFLLTLALYLLRAFR